MRADRLVEILATFSGRPRIVVQEEMDHDRKRMALIFNYHRQARRCFRSFWKQEANLRPVGQIWEYRTRSHDWIKKNSSRGAQVTVWFPNHAGIIKTERCHVTI